MSNTKEIVRISTALAENGLPTFKNAELAQATADIGALVQTATESMGKIVNSVTWMIAKRLAEIDGKQIFKEDGFANCAEYAQKTFGYGKTMAYALINAGKKASLIESLPNGDEYSVGQVMEMPKDDKELVAMAESGEIGPDMTAKEIREVVKKAPSKARVRAELKYQFIELGNDDNNIVMTQSEFDHDCAELGILWVEHFTHEEKHYIAGLDNNHRPVMWERVKIAKPDKKED